MGRSPSAGPRLTRDRSWHDRSIVTVAGGQGFYGDTPAAADALLAEGVDYLCLEALAELTLAILQKDRQRDETRGYTRDLPAYLARALPYVADGRTKVVTNAGGINPAAAARAAIDTARSLGITGHHDRDRARRRPAAAARRRSTRPASRSPTSTRGAAFDALPAPPLFASAYLGARPIADALAQGADIVITGRVADASLFLGPLAYEHGWAWDDWDRLAAGILVGHLLECSGQSLGGNYSGDWWALPHPWDLPYPIADVDADGTATIRKPDGSGGRVSTDTLRHQLLYEVHDPARYLSPDVVADFTSAQLRGSRTATACASPACAAPPRPTPTSCCSRTTRAGPANRASRSRGRTRTRRRRRPPRSS